MGCTHTLAWPAALLPLVLLGNASAVQSLCRYLARQAPPFPKAWPARQGHRPASCHPPPPTHQPALAGLAFKAGDTEESTRDVRTSSGTFLSRGEDPAGVLAYIEVAGAILL